MEPLNNKLEKLENILSSYPKLCVGFSGGVDSTFLLKIAKKVLGDNVFAVIGDGAMLSRADLAEAIKLAEEMGASYHVLELDPLAVKEFRNNDKERCYYCKKTIFSAIKDMAFAMGATHVADGKNADDAKVYRPGIKAATELKVVSPLYEAGFSKDDIRKCSKSLGLTTWDKPSNACLATRFPYDTTLTLEKLKTVEAAEGYLQALGMKGVRVRIHDDIARIEAPKEYFSKIIENGAITDYIKALGIKYITLDLEGFRSGSMD